VSLCLSRLSYILDNIKLIVADYDEVFVPCVRCAFAQRQGSPSLIHLPRMLDPPRSHLGIQPFLLALLVP